MAEKTVSPTRPGGKQSEEADEPRVRITSRRVPVDSAPAEALTRYDVTLDFGEIANALGCMEHDPHLFARGFLRTLSDEIDVLRAGSVDGADLGTAFFAMWSRVSLAGALLEAIEAHDSAPAEVHS